MIPLDGGNKKATDLFKRVGGFENFKIVYFINESKRTFSCTLSPRGKKRNTCLASRQTRDDVHFAIH
ncbi:MAG: hypothetical protein A3D87_02055 [Omnitrophica WOR_2 bacterium RIFCSPHIGHO2_02_FULL_50_17]|nr:MAG: hypothetical protein A3D87_02055 [Omnitrophica WOR_2 bacterium RIFCSPHIGHO2_02_FULL_50_17]